MDLSHSRNTLRRPKVRLVTWNAPRGEGGPGWDFVILGLVSDFVAVLNLKAASGRRWKRAGTARITSILDCYSFGEG